MSKTQIKIQTSQTNPVAVIDDDKFRGFVAPKKYISEYQLKKIIKNLNKNIVQKKDKIIFWDEKEIANMGKTISIKSKTNNFN